MTSNYGSMAAAYIFRSEAQQQQGYTELEKRRLFLRSYQFSRKQSVGSRINKSFFKMRKAILVRFRSAAKLRKTLWFKLKNSLFRRRRFFLRLHSHNYFTCNCNCNYSRHSSSSSCFC